ncbi:MAG: hypothetical protein H6711_15715 [Myxococcales bacterium]|nr:hypothetical protein [Myxococcales bacterium]
MVAALASCDAGPDLPELLVEAPPVSIYGDKVSICRGAVVAISSHIQAVSADLSGSASFPEEIDLLLTVDASALCDSGQGCTLTERSPVLSIAEEGSVLHELAHAVQEIRTGGSPAPWLLEGFAESWSGRGGRMPKYPSALDLAAESSWDVDYSGARHLVRWIRGRLSRDDFAALFLESSEDLVPRLEHLLENSWDGLQHEFWESAPLYDPGPLDCADVSMVVDVTRPAALRGTFDCDDESTQGVLFAETASTQLTVPLVLEVESDASYRVQVLGGTAYMLPCEPVDDPVEAAFWAHVEEAHDLPALVTSASRDATYFLRAGRYHAWVGSGTEGDFTFSIQPDYRVSRHALIE